MHEKLILVIARTIGTVWLIIGVYAIAAALLIERDRLTVLVIGVLFSVAGIWLICTRNPFGALGKRN